MVQIIQERKKPSFSERLNAGISRGLDIGEQLMQQQKAEKQMQQENEQLKKLTGVDFSGIRDPKLRQQITGELLQQQGKQANLNQKEQFINKILGTQSQQREPIQEDISYQQQGFNPLDISDADIARATSMDPNLGRSLRDAKDAAIKENREQKKSEEAKVIASKKETLPLRKEFADKAKYARQGIENKKLALNLLKKGKIDDPLVVQIASYLPGALGNKLLSSDTQLYKAGLFDEFGVLKSMFPGAIRVKEIELLEDKLATLDKNDEAKAKILENGMKKLERDVILSKAARQVEKENPQASLLDFESLVAEKAQPELNKLYQEIVDDYDKIYLEYAPSKSSYVDQHGEEYTNVPKSKLKEFFEEAKSQGIELRPKK